MVKGLDRFRDYFADYRDRYVLIGGAALWLVLDEAGLEPRATRDLDVVLCIEVLDPEFASHFWGFVEQGGYQVQEKVPARRPSTVSANRPRPIIRKCWNCSPANRISWSWGMTAT